MGVLTRLSKLPEKGGIGCARPIPKSFKLLLPFAKILIDNFAISKIKRERTEDLLKANTGKRIRNTVRRFPPKKRINNRIQRNAAFCQEIPAISLFDVFRDHKPVALSISLASN